jgi:hypothetical protein
MDAILVPTTGVHPITGQHIAVCSIVTHDKIRDTIVIQIIQQETIPSRSSFGLNPRFRHRQGTRRQYPRSKTPFCCLKRRHRTGQPDQRQRHSHKHFGKTGSALCLK